MSTGDARLLTIAEQSAHFLLRDHEGPPPGPVTGAAAWLGRDLARTSDWVEVLPPEALASFDRALETARRADRPLDALTADDFPMPDLAETLARWRRTLTHGRGFLVLRGVPVERWDADTQKLFMRGLGLQFGHLGYQNPRGDVIGEVMDTGADKRDPFARLYATSGEFRFHCDASDLVGLLCVRPARKGGESRVASSVSVYNALREQRPDLAARLFTPLPFDLRNEQPAGAAPFGELAPCAYSAGVLKTFYISDYYRSIERLDHPQAAANRELCDHYDAIAGSPEIGLSFYLQPGDLQILYNHTTLHARTAFEDDPEQPRLLLRFLVSMDV